jgi:hypothetical protein
MTFSEWLEAGIKAGFCSEVVCGTHDGTPLTDAERAEFEESDPCIPVVRLWPA